MWPRSQRTSCPRIGPLIALFVDFSLFGMSRGCNTSGWPGTDASRPFAWEQEGINASRHARQVISNSPTALTECNCNLRDIAQLEELQALLVRPPAELPFWPSFSSSLFSLDSPRWLAPAPTGVLPAQQTAIAAFMHPIKGPQNAK